MPWGKFVLERFYFKAGLGQQVPIVLYPPAVVAVTRRR